MELVSSACWSSLHCILSKGTTHCPLQNIHSYLVKGESLTVTSVSDSDKRQQPGIDLSRPRDRDKALNVHHVMRPDTPNDPSVRVCCRRRLVRHKQIVRRTKDCDWMKMSHVKHPSSLKNNFSILQSLIRNQSGPYFELLQKTCEKLVYH